MRPTLLPSCPQVPAPKKKTEMKLKVREVGAEVEREIDIRNPRATVANLRAAIGVTWKIKDSNSFRMSSQGADLDTATKLLGEAGLKEGDLITFAMKRAREEETVASAPAPASATLVANEGVKAPDVASTPSQAAVAQSNTSAPAPSAASQPTSSPAADGGLQKLIDMGFPEGAARAALSMSAGNTERATELLLSGNIPAAGTTAADDDDDFEDVDDEDDEEDPDEEFQDDDDGEEDEEDIEGEMSPEEQEQAQLAMGLLQLGHPRELSAQFLANPQEVMARIQRERPDLFDLIARHNQFFLDLVNTGATLSGDDLEEGEEDEEEEDSDEDDEERDPLDYGLIPRGGRGRGRAGRGAGGSEGAPAGSPGSPARPLTDEDNARIDSLMALGFTREQCIAAYLRCGRNAERAANFLFENPPS
jgi:hypothetical protein